MNLQQRALSQFDLLFERNELLWNETKPVIVPSHPFDFTFRIAPALRSKPIDTKQTPPTATSSSSSPAHVTKAFPERTGPWHLGTYHAHDLILNKFCVVRPQFVLPTRDFRPQADPLDRHDFGAAYDVLCDLPVTPARPGPGWAVIFNGGVLAGSSVGWKHLQVLPREGGAEVVAPGEAKGKGKGLLDVLSERLRGEDEGVIVHILGVPFKHAACRVPADLAASPARVVEGNGEDPSAPGVRLEALYQRLRANLGYVEGPHNVLLTDDVLLVIPRRKAWMKEEGIAANAAGMVGMVWCWSDDQFDTFVRIGPMKVLEEFGVPWDEAESGKEGAGSGVV